MKTLYKIAEELMKQPKGCLKWKFIPGFDNVQISNHGDIRTVREREVLTSVLTGSNKSRCNFSIRKCVEASFRAKDRFRGDEFWVLFPHPDFQMYRISNYGRLKVIRITVLWPQPNMRVMVRKGGKLKSLSIVRAYANVFLTERI